MQRALLLDQPAPDIATALAHHGFVQIDPINVCGRMHDLILRNRVAGYCEGDLMRHLHGEDKPLSAESRTTFEHHQPATGNLVAFTSEAWPHLQREMRARTKMTSAWCGRLTKVEQDLVAPIFEAIREQGPIGSDTIKDTRKSKRTWGLATLPKSTMQKLFFHGRLLIAQRQGIRRLYDLPEHVLPPKILQLPEPTRHETERWEAQLKLRQRRLASLKRAELAAIEDLVQPVQIAERPLLYCLQSDVPLFDQIHHRNSKIENDYPRLIAPLDPLIYDRRVTEQVWGFNYTWEVYTPAAKRMRGYYALPVLSQDELVGHIDPKADRKQGKLAVISRRVKRGHPTTPAVKALAAFLQLRT